MCPFSKRPVIRNTIPIRVTPSEFTRTCLLLVCAVAATTQTALAQGTVPPQSPRQALQPVSGLEEIPGSLRLDRATAVRLAETRAPEVIGAEAEVRGVAGFRRAADRGLHRPPRIEVSAGPRHVPGGGRLGVDASVGIFQEFSTGQYGKELDRFAASTKVRADSHLEATRRDARVRASLAWLDALEARAILVIRKRSVEGAKEILRIAQARVAAGRSSPGEAALAQSLLGSAEAAVLAAEGSITVADANLRHVCGIELHRPLQVTGTLDAGADSIHEESLRAHVRDSSPDLLAAKAEASTAEQAARLGRASSRPFLDLGPSVTRESTGEWLVLGHVRLPLPGIDPAAADNAERQLLAHMARAEAGVTEQAVLKNVEIDLHEREHAIRVRDLLKTGSIEPAERAAREAELQYEAGRTDLVSVIAARRQLYDAHERWTQAATDVQRAEARLERYVAVTQLQKGRLAPGGK